MKFVNWNVKRATLRSKHSAEILNRIDQHSPEIVCLTKTHPKLLQDGHPISARPDYGYGIRENHRKVLLWSSEPWKDVDEIGDEEPRFANPTIDDFEQLQILDAESDNPHVMPQLERHAMCIPSQRSLIAICALEDR